MSNDLVSIIIPVFNGEKWMEHCIQSALRQTYENIEIILVNDGSTDGSKRIAESYQAKSGKIRYAEKPNGGQASSRNLGLEISKGTFIQFLDCDDTLEPNAIALAVDAIREREDISFVLYGFRIWQGNRLLRTPHAQKGVYKLSDGYESFLKISPLLASVCNKLYRRGYIHGRFREDCVFGEDLYFNLTHLTRETVIAAIEDCLYNVSLSTADSVNKRYRKGKLRDIILTRELEEQTIKALYGAAFNETQFRAGELSTLAFTLEKSIVSGKYADVYQEIREIREMPYLDNMLSVLGSARLRERIPLHLLRTNHSKLLYFYCKASGRIRTAFMKLIN